MKKKKKNTILSAVRTLLTAGGTYLAAKGKISEGEAVAIVGAVVALISAFWDAADEHVAENIQPEKPSDLLDHP